MPPRVKGGRARNVVCLLPRLDSGTGDRARLAHGIFLAGLLVQIALRVYQVGVPIARREAPIETDDAYTYIIKAEQLASCPFQDCPALEDLRPQLSRPSPDPAMAWDRYREYGRAFLVYHPLHSILMNAGHAAGLSWESAYNALSIAGAAFIGCAIALWLHALLGPGPAGFGLLLTAFVLFEGGQGLNHIVPSNMALGIAMATWGAMLTQRRAAPWIVFLGIAAMLAMHPVGRLYAGVTVAAFLLTRYPERRRGGDLAAAAAGAALTAAAFALPHLVSRPELTIRPEPPPILWFKVWGYFTAVAAAARSLSSWSSTYGGPLVVTVLVAAGLARVPAWRRRAVWVFLLLLGGLATVAMFYLLPRNPANVFSRVWVGLAILLSGAMGLAAWTWLVAVLDRLRRGRRPRPSLASSVTLVLLGLLVAGATLTGVVRGGTSVLKKTERRTARHPFALDPAQPRALLQRSIPSDAVVYMDEIPMHFYITHGALGRPAVYAPTLVGTPERSRWIDGNHALRFVVAWNPTTPMPTARHGGLALHAQNPLRIRASGSASRGPLRLLIANPGDATRLTVARVSEGLEEDLVDLDLQGGWSGWVPLPREALAAGGELALRAPADDREMIVMGVRVGADTVLSWPWDQGIELAYRGDDGEETVAAFRTSGLFPSLDGELRVIDDAGSTVLAEILP